jgi:hypothetical protein
MPDPLALPLSIDRIVSLYHATPPWERQEWAASTPARAALRALAAFPLHWGLASVPDRLMGLPIVQDEEVDGLVLRARWTA